MSRKASWENGGFAWGTCRNTSCICPSWCLEINVWNSESSCQLEIKAGESSSQLQINPARTQNIDVGVWIWTNQRVAKTFETKKHTCLSTGRVGKESVGFGIRRPGFWSQHSIVGWRLATEGEGMNLQKERGVRQEWGKASTYKGAPSTSFFHL